MTSLFLLLAFMIGGALGFCAFALFQVAGRLDDRAGD
jgi:hypothetical protein